MMALHVNDLWFSYGRHRVLQGVTFGVEKGEMVFILGKNGAGKSTLFKCILGHVKKTGGVIEIDGAPLESYPPRALAKRVAYIPQAGAPTYNYTVRQMVTMGRTVHLPLFSSPTREDDAMVSEALERMGILDLAEKGFDEISGGERQLALIARALVQKGGILLMDEPTSHLDFGNQLRVLQRIKGLTQSGLTVLVISHNPQHALHFGSRVLALDGGTARAFGAPKEVLQPDLVRALYGVDVAFARHGEETLILPQWMGN
ncbi:MAG: ABC transporter ATP-binding protein [Christensenellales bacterium]|jgi:iron complex transport system ATP-binding protein